jgi:hypothetical protein
VPFIPISYTLYPIFFIVFPPILGKFLIDIPDWQDIIDIPDWQDSLALYFYKSRLSVVVLTGEENIGRFTNGKGEGRTFKLRQIAPGKSLCLF